MVCSTVRAYPGALPELIVTRKSHHAPANLRHEEARTVTNGDSHFGLAPLLRIEGDRSVPDDRILDLRKPSGIAFNRGPDNHGSTRVPSGVEIRATRRFSGPCRTVTDPSVFSAGKTSSRPDASGWNTSSERSLRPTSGRVLHG